MDINNDNIGIYTESEINRLNKYSSMRDAMIDVMFKGGTPEDNKDIRLANELLSAGEKSLHDAAANRAKHQDNMAKEAILETVAETLKLVSLNTNIDNTGNRALNIEDSNVPKDVVAGELEINPEPLDPTDFILEEGENTL